ncbi:MAG: hypothetical protein KDD83_14560 [Caldilineaceae bacterium]|nr:hypothetical protein [Caldilineaceae bacterium]
MQSTIRNAPATLSVCLAALLTALGLVLMLSAPTPVRAAPTEQTVPDTISYQGTLRDSEGNLITGTRTMTFRIYTLVVGGSAEYEKTFTNVQVRDGIFNVVLDGLPAALFETSTPLYIGVTVSPDPLEMTPRQRLHPVPQAHHAATAGTATTLVDGATVGQVTVNGGLTANSQLTANGPVTVNGDFVLPGGATAQINRSLSMTGYLYANTINTSERGGVIWQDTWMDGDQERHAQWRLIQDARSGPEYSQPLTLYRVDQHPNSGAGIYKVFSAIPVLPADEDEMGDGETDLYSVFKVYGAVQATGGFNGSCRTAANGGGTLVNPIDCNQDVAETFATDSRTEPGDLVVLLPEDRAVPAVTVSGGAYAPGLIGIVSSNPGLVFDQGETYLAGDNSNLISDDKTVVAMIGRVPAKFSLENGAIAVGDPLTSASLPGAAMKATQAGPIVGYALQSSDEAVDGKLLVWLQPGAYLPPAQLDALNQLAAAQTAAQTPATANAQTAQSGLPLMGGMLMAGAAALLMLRKRRA